MNVCIWNITLNICSSNKIKKNLVRSVKMCENYTFNIGALVSYISFPSHLSENIINT